ncbi:MAG TPA: hypothetical protein DDZ89_22210, partial [Clostridiales bacterium]|nr:hypothetical protein [Clostridiales bacterium]
IQLLFFDVPDQSIISVRLTDDFEDRKTDCYELVPVFVEDSSNIDHTNPVPYCPNRVAPFYIYDCLKPLGEKVTPKDGTVGLYLSFPIDKKDKPGLLSGTVMIVVRGHLFEIPIQIRIHEAIVPEKGTLKMVNGYSSSKIPEYFHVEDGSPDHKRIDAEHLHLLRRMRQNMMYVGGVITTRDEEGNYQFDFSPLEHQVEYYQSFGFQYFLMSSVGGRKSWKESTILVGPERLPAMSYEAFRYLSQYLPALRRFLKEKDWTDCFLLGVSDEPNDANATEFRALCGLVRKFFPEIRLADALSYTAVHGALDVWIPLNAEYDKHQKEFESYRTGKDELWHYVCCVPRKEGYINRFMDYPLLSTRYLFWGNYKYRMTGYLHWASNVYQPGQDPFKQNNPSHRNADSVCILPPGDTHVIYPGKDRPWMSMRLEAHRQSAEEYELFKILEKRNKQKADALCEQCFKSFNKVEYNPVLFEQTRIQLLEEASKGTVLNK